MNSIFRAGSRRRDSRTLLIPWEGRGVEQERERETERERERQRDDFPSEGPLLCAESNNLLALSTTQTATPVSTVG